jgi:hypothetical protein
VYDGAVMNSNTSTTSLSSTGASAEAISRRAYQIWEQEGRPEGCDLRHWLQAEQELGSDHNGNGAGAPENGAAAAARYDELGTAQATPVETRPLQGTRTGSTAKRAAGTRRK